MTPNDTFPAVQTAVDAAARAQAAWAATPRAARAAALRAIAARLETQREALVALADEETHLGPVRLNGELHRTQFQLEAFAQALERGEAWRPVDDKAVPGAPPVGRPRLVRVQRPVGPVAMFSASNFPFAFSVVGGDTASALAAGCAVVVKSHSGHPRLSRRVFELAAEALRSVGAPEGTMGLVDQGREAGVALVRHPAIAAVAFTGSFHGGQALWREAMNRPVPIPFYGELGSINPVVVLPGVPPQAASTLAGSITQGCGQFCTRPGIVLVPSGAEHDGFIAALAEALRAQQPHAMLSAVIRKGFEGGARQWARHAAVRMHLSPGDADAPAPTPVLGETDAAALVADAQLREEVFGPAALVVRYTGVAQAIEVLRAVGGALTVTLWGGEEATDAVRDLAAQAQQIAGRVLFAGVPTGVAVCAAQQHGGPWPASTAPQTTSVGLAALQRFLRPVALQDPPAWLLREEGLDA